MEKVLKGKHFADVEEVKQKRLSTKRLQNRQVQKLFWAMENILYITSDGEYFEGDWSLNM